MPRVEARAPRKSKRPEARGDSGMNLTRGDDHGDADGHVDEEPGPPRDPFGERAADHEAQAGADSRDGAVGCHGAGAFPACGERRRQQGERGGRDDGRADSLECPGGDQPRVAGGGSDQEGREGEDGETADEHAAAAQDVPEAGAEQQQSAEHQRVGVLDPGQSGGRKVQSQPGSWAGR